MAYLIGEEVELQLFLNERWVTIEDTTSSAKQLLTDQEGKVSICLNDSMLTNLFDDYISKPNRCTPYKLRLKVDHSFAIGYIWSVPSSPIKSSSITPLYH